MLIVIHWTLLRGWYPWVSQQGPKEENPSQHTVVGGGLWLWCEKVVKGGLVPPKGLDPQQSVRSKQRRQA